MPNGSLDFRILGPLAVRLEGEAMPLGGPKQRALLALLLLSANRVVSRDLLIEELFAGQSVNSADHALRNHVSRLRKALQDGGDGTPRLVARAPGYLLRVEPGELDLERFEELLLEGREALVAGDAATATSSLRRAESLWRGRPFADLEFEPFARVEVERLEELRLAALEERIEAELALGRHKALVPELEAVSSEQPYRERFRAQLMLALYRSGRQVEGLDVYRRTRQLFHQDLGLEPGPELQELERAILVQNPVLRSPLAHGDAPIRVERPVCPFKGLAPFEEADREFFCGRERLVDELVGRFEGSASLLAITGPSGSGKSSLLRAGLVPALTADGRVRAIVLRPGERPATELARVFSGGLPEALARLDPGCRLVVAVDQLEEVFAAAAAEHERAAFVAALCEAAWDPERRVLIVVALRADFVGRLPAYGELADLIAANHVLLGPMTATELRRAIEVPARRVGLEVEPALLDTLVDEVAGEAGALPLLSATLLDLWEGRDDAALTLASYRRTGGLRGAIARQAEAAWRAMAPEEQRLARRILLRLVADGEGAAPTRRRATLAELDPDREDVGRVLAVLVERRLLVTGDGSVELVHEALIEHWPRLAGWLEDDAEGRLVQRHLSEAALAWSGGGRDPADLYRGARLAAALDWQQDAGAEAGLNNIEEEFLDQSRGEAVREQERQRRSNRRLRVLLGAAAALLAAAATGGILAFVERGTARAAATAAEAQRVGAQALVEPNLDRTLLLARAGVSLDDTAATESNLLAALLRSPAAVRVFRGSTSRVIDDALSPDGRLLAARDNSGNVAFFDTRTGRVLGPRFVAGEQLGLAGMIRWPPTALAFSPDGKTLAAGSTDGNTGEIYLIDTRTHRQLAFQQSSLNVVVDALFSADGRTVVTGEVPWAGHPPPETIVARRASDLSWLRQSRPLAAGRLAGFANGRRDLLVTTGDSSSLLLNMHTLRPVRRFALGGVAAVSPGGRLAAFGRPDGTIVLLDLSTGARRTLTGRASASIEALTFRANSRMLASTSDDGSVAVWDLRSQSISQTFPGHASAALGPLFSPDGQTVYAAGDDGSVIAWDIGGERSLGRPFRFASYAAAHANNTRTGGASTAVAVSLSGRFFATSPRSGVVTLWRANNLHKVGELHGPRGFVQALAFSHDDRKLAAVLKSGATGRTLVWQLASHTLIRKLGSDRQAVPDGVAFSPDDQLLATAGLDGLVRVYRLHNGRLIGSDQLNGSLVNVDFSPDGRFLAAASLSGQIDIWNVGRRTVTQTIEHGRAVFSLSFLPDSTLATGDNYGNIDFWNPKTGRPLPGTLGQSEPVLSLSVDRTGDRLLTSSTQGKLRLWDLATRKLIGAPLPASDHGGNAALSPDGHYALGTFATGNGIIWDTDPASWQTRACQIANGNLTQAEWRDFLPSLPGRRVCT